MDKAVFVLGVLHDLHARSEGYTYWHLLKLLDAYAPDLVCLEIGPERLAAGDFRRESPEKWGIGLPWAVAKGVSVAGVDGDGDPKHFERYKLAWAQFARDVGDTEKVLKELEERAMRLLEAAGGWDELVRTYEKANSRRTQEVFRQTHELAEATLGRYGNGELTDSWRQRNDTMLRRTLAAMAEHGAHRAIVLVGAEHKYALDALFGDRPDLKVLQLSDFLDAPVVLTEAEREAFKRGEAPITYPSDLMFVHRKLHGGEPGSYSQTLPPEPNRLDLSGVPERIDAALAQRPDDPDWLYYRGLYRYCRGEYHNAIRDFEAVAADHEAKFCVSAGLWELGEMRRGQMLDLLGGRDAAIKSYQRVLHDGSGLFADQVRQLMR